MVAAVTESSNGSRSRTRRAVVLVLVCLALVSVLVVGWRILVGLTVRGAVSVVEADVRNDGLLVLSVDSCNGDPSVSVLEENDRVRIAAVASSTPFGGGDDCLDIVEVRLQRPLEDRAVVDAHSGDVVSVSRSGE
jgi:hypothetical protein